MEKERNLLLMFDNKGIDVVAAGASHSRERKYLPIRFPIRKGLNGVRIPLVHSSNKDILKTISSIVELKKLLVIQHHLWSDTTILELSGFNLMKSGYYKGIFLMLDKKRVDYFPRSILEVGSEYETHKHLNIEIEQHTLLYYKTAYYFYVNKKNIELANDIEFGLEAALKDGSFEQIFIKYNSYAINLLRQNKRKVFNLTNPLLPDNPPIHRKELWFDPVLIEENHK